ncbi:hypothetical protein Q4610_15655 [Sphingobium sp. HBC34]|uniref:Uncharacterized protein n=1 Tax=Sphingobium cyanobacteriorum TaxID=3063954 RepID=A0ABT8ZQW7_9SPHN|nr:hypothetical protein [Sphingobium sp. HBC34]MDO7836483.1 hypothetical protein [Sphingobium sp. HBC34]
MLNDPDLRYTFADGGGQRPAVVVHPGLIMTDLGKHLTPEDFENICETLRDYREYIQQIKTLEAGAMDGRLRVRTNGDANASPL